MGKFSGPKEPDIPDTPPEPPEPPTTASEEVQAASTSQRRRERAARGRQSTFLTGPLGTPVGPQAAQIATKQLLGQA